MVAKGRGVERRMVRSLLWKRGAGLMESGNGELRVVEMVATSTMRARVVARAMVRRERRCISAHIIHLEMGFDLFAFFCQCSIIVFATKM
jgi:hypothetical protein